MPDEPRFNERWALLIGVSRYRRVRSLKWAAKDATNLRDALIGKLGFREENVILISDDSLLEPDHSEICDQLGRLTAGNFGQDDLLVFHYSGHGVRDDAANQDLLLPNGATVMDLHATGIPLERVMSKLRRRFGSVVLFLDMCREEDDGAGTKGGITKGVGSATAEWITGREREGMATFFSCDPREYSYEIDALEQGCFTHCVLQAIDSPEVNTIGELDEYLRKHVPRVNYQHGKKPQQPRLIPNPREIEALRLLQRMRAGPSEGSALANELIECFNRGGLSPALLALGLQLTDPERESTSPWEQAMARLLKAYCAGTLSLEELEAAYRWGQKQVIGKPPIQGPQSFSNGKTGDAT